MALSARLMHAALLRWLDEFAGQGIIATDTDLVVQGWNQWLARHTGRSAESIIGQPLLEAFPEIRARGLDRYYRKALSGEVSVLAHSFHRYLIEIRPRIDGTSTPMPQTCRIAPLVAEGQIVGTITVIEDVSDRVRSEAELRRQIASAEHARQMAEDASRLKDEFLATLSHEIRTPLNAVMGWTRILLSRRVDEATLENALRVIDRNARAQSRLVEDMLDMARIVTGKLRLETAPMDLVSVTAAAIDVVAPTAAAKGIRLVASLPNRPKAIIADADRVQQIVWNLLSNAVKFTPPGGTIEIVIPDEPGPAKLIVRDTGQGISPEFLPYIFERFRQANASASRTEGGLGLGLALVRQLVELHGGTIVAESEGRGKGAVFTVTFPEMRDEASPDDRRRLIGTPLSGVRILIVDDDPDWRQLMSLSLEGLGAQVRTANNVEDAMTMMRGSARPPNVILADVGAPGTNGYALLDALRTTDGRLSSVPVIAVSRFAARENESRAMAAGFRRHVAKPVDPDTVARLVLDVVKNEPERGNAHLLRK